MATPAQAAAATVGAGSLAAAGAYGITQAVNGSGEETPTEEQESPADPEIPTPVTFSAQDLASYTDKVINVVKEEHLIKLVKAVDENDKWWDWAFKNRYSNKEGLTVETTFNNLSNSTALKNACKTAYEKPKTNFNDDNFLETIGAFCTSEKLTTLEPKFDVYGTAAVTGYDHGLLSVDANKAKLIKVKKEETDTNKFNDIWWNWAFKNIFKSSNTVAPFSGVTSGYSDQDQITTALNQACNAAYKKLYFELTENNGALLRDTKKFCSVNKETTELTLPGPANPSFINGKVNSESPYNTENSLAKTGDNKTKLVDPDTANKNWWIWTYDQSFPKTTETEKISKLPTMFQKVTSGFKDSADGTAGQQTALNQACKEAYGKTNGNLGQLSEDNSIVSAVKKFCVPKSITADLTLPS